MEGPNLFAALRSHLRARRLAAPDPTGTGTVDHAALDQLLVRLDEQGLRSLDDAEHAIGGYIAALGDQDPDTLGRDEALAYWLNLYNAGALDVARRTRASGKPTVLRTPGAFEDPFVTVAGEKLSLDGIEHGKIRRFQEPRIHAALVCGAASCPTLRHEAYRGDRLDSQLDDQMERFLASGAARVEDDTLHLSRVFLWYGGDIARRHRMPTLLPARKKTVARALLPWMEDETADAVHRGVPIRYDSYDWTLACSVG